MRKRVIDGSDVAVTMKCMEGNLRIFMANREGTDYAN